MLDELWGFINGNDGIIGFGELSGEDGILWVTCVLLLSGGGLVLLNIFDGLSDIDFGISKGGCVVLKESLVGSDLDWVVSDGLLEVVGDLFMYFSITLLQAACSTLLRASCLFWFSMIPLARVFNKRFTSSAEPLDCMNTCTIDKRVFPNWSESTSANTVLVS